MSQEEKKLPVFEAVFNKETKGVTRIFLTKEPLFGNAIIIKNYD